MEDVEENSAEIFLGVGSLEATRLKMISQSLNF